MEDKNKIDDGGSAFPIGLHFPELHAQGYDYFGMSLRDYFAGQALMGMLADHTGIPVTRRYAQISYELADAMIEERKRILIKNE